MKTIIRTTLLCAIALTNLANGHAASQERLIIGDIQHKNISLKLDYNEYLDVKQITQFEIEKLNKFDVLSRADVKYYLPKDTLNLINCSNTGCYYSLLQATNADYILSGNIGTTGNNIVIQYKLYDKKTKGYEKSVIREFSAARKKYLSTMIKITIRTMFNLPNVEAEEEALRPVKMDFETQNVSQKILRANGVRMGATYFIGETAEILQSKKAIGGYGVKPYMFQFGYQFEKEYINQGNFQALFEFLPMITGMDQGLFIPSFTLMHGVRNNKSGWEFAFGPSISFVRKSEGYFNSNNQWTLSSDSSDRISPIPSYEKRLDSRGDLYFQPSFVFAIGKSFRSGNMNIPMNAFFVPSTDGIRLGVSFGFNSNRNKL